jgi:acyl-coenzyme A synthetase/AMP-(fatty) acid ligase
LQLPHPAVRERAVVGAPDAKRGAFVEAYIVLHAGVIAKPQLIEQLQRFVKGCIAPFKYAHTIGFLDELPKTQTGRVQRSVLQLCHAS